MGMHTFPGLARARYGSLMRLLLYHHTNQHLLQHIVIHVYKFRKAGSRQRLDCLGAGPVVISMFFSFPTTCMYYHSIHGVVIQQREGG